MEFYIFCLNLTKRLTLIPDKPLLFSKRLHLKVFFLNSLLEEEKGKKKKDKQKDVQSVQWASADSGFPTPPHHDSTMKKP